MKEKTKQEFSKNIKKKKNLGRLYCGKNITNDDNIPKQLTK